MNLNEIRDLFDEGGNANTTMALLVAGAQVPYLLGIIEGLEDKLTVVSGLLAVEKLKNSKYRSGSSVHRMMNAGYDDEEEWEDG